MITVTLPIRTLSESNARDHWAVRAKRTRQARMIVGLAVGAGCRNRHFASPVTVTLTRITPRKLDDDNLRGALKACRDGVADALGVDDGDPHVTWQYGQRRGKRGEWAVEITVTP